MTGIRRIGNIAAILLPLIGDGLSVCAEGGNRERRRLAVRERQRFGLSGETKRHRWGNAHRVLAAQVRFDQGAVLRRKLALENNNLGYVSPEKPAGQPAGWKHTSSDQQ